MMQTQTQSNSMKNIWLVLKMCFNKTYTHTHVAKFIVTISNIIIDQSTEYIREKCSDDIVFLCSFHDFREVLLYFIYLFHIETLLHMPTHRLLCQTGYI